VCSKDVRFVLSRWLAFHRGIARICWIRCCRPLLCQCLPNRFCNLFLRSLDEQIYIYIYIYVCMWEDGADIKSQIRYGASKPNLALAQLLQYNCSARHNEGVKTHRHEKIVKLLSQFMLGCLYTQDIGTGKLWKCYTRI
jgi:hypothetical protein